MYRLKLMFYTLFNEVYAYTPHWASSDNSGSDPNANFCDGKTGIHITNGKIHICPPKSSEGENIKTGMTTVFDNLQLWVNITTITGIFVCVFSLVFSAIQLAMSAGQPRQKQKASQRIKISLIGLAIFGGIKVIIGYLLSLGLGA